MKKTIIIVLILGLIGGYMANKPKVPKAFDATTDKGALAWSQKSGGVPFSTKYLKKIGYTKPTK